MAVFSVTLKAKLVSCPATWGFASSVAEMNISCLGKKHVKN